jgi:hypothetical protein
MQYLYSWGPIKAPLRLDEFVGAATNIEIACVQGYLQFGQQSGFALYEIEVSSLAWACWTNGAGCKASDLCAGTVDDALANEAKRLWIRGESVYRLDRIGSASRQRRTRAPYYWLLLGERKATLVIDPRQAAQIHYLDEPSYQRAAHAVFA